MAFKFGQRQVGDPAAQQNFEQLEGVLGVFPEIEHVGPLAGNGAIIPNPITGLSGFALDYTITEPRKVRIEYQARFDATAAAWNWLYTRVVLSAGTASYHLKSGNNGYSDLKSYYSGASWNMNHGWDYFELTAPGTYTFQVQASSSAGQVNWSPVAENYMLLQAWPL